MVEGWYYQY